MSWNDWDDRRDYYDDLDRRDYDRDRDRIRDYNRDCDRIREFHDDRNRQVDQRDFERKRDESNEAFHDAIISGNRARAWDLLGVSLPNPFLKEPTLKRAPKKR